MLASPAVQAVVIDTGRCQARVHLRDRCSKPAGRLVDSLVTMASEERREPSVTDGHDATQSGAVCWSDPVTGLDSYARAPAVATGLKRATLLAGALLTFVLAVLGVVLPGLPTTPFLLLTSYCLLRSSRSLHERLLRTRVFGALLRDWHTHRGVRPGVKTKSLAVLAIAVGATIALSGLPVRAMIGVAACSMIGAVCICRLRVIEAPQARQDAAKLAGDAAGSLRLYSASAEAPGV
ncbi:MAG: YbaN family protein [Planctomycetota bacterium]